MGGMISNSYAFARASLLLLDSSQEARRKMRWKPFVESVGGITVILSMLAHFERVTPLVFNAYPCFEATIG